MKTVIQDIIDSITEINNKGIEVTNKGMLVMLENAKEFEKKQIFDAFNEGMEYGERGSLQTFDFPASRYYIFTYTE